MTEYKKEKIQTEMVTVRVPKELKKKLLKAKLNISKICRDALEKVEMDLFRKSVGDAFKKKSKE